MNSSLAPQFVYRDSPEDQNHWQLCIARKQPHIIIRREGGKNNVRFARVEYDIFPCIIFGLELKTNLLESVLPIYHAYCSFYGLPADKQESIGGSDSLSCRVYVEHAEIICSQLFKYLNSFLQENRVTHTDKYSEAMESLSNGHQGLRFVLDPHCAEFESASNEQRISMMRELAKSDSSFSNVISGYVFTYLEYKPHVVEALREGLLYNIRLWHKVYPQDDDYGDAMLEQTANKELAEILLDKIRAVTVY